MICGNCTKCFAFGKWCSGCPGCHRLFKTCFPGRLCSSCHFICPDKPGLEAFINRHLRGTLELEPLSVKQRIELPEHLPLVATRLFETLPLESAPWAAVHTAKMPSKVWSFGLVREHYGLSGETKTVLGFYSPDRVLEQFWLRRGERYGMIKKEFDAAFAPNFSVYDDAPRMEHIFNMRRSNMVAAEMAAYGVAVIPDIGWYNKEDLDRWAEFTAKSNIGAVAFSFQTVGRSSKSRAVWKSSVAGLRYFCQNVPKGIRVVIVGVNSVPRMAEVFNAAGERPLTFLDTTSFYTARKGGALKETGRDRDAKSSGMSRDQAFFKSVEVFRKRIGAAKNRALED